jgi:cellulose synthase/poly-beta-1,6-N-acetylglucosamine synthase-like glycosyltransferase
MTALVAIILAPLILLAAFFAIEVLAGLGRPRTEVQSSSASAVIVVPAHDEEAVIGDALRSLKEVLGDRMQILVVADNCEDSTAQRARDEGVEVIERDDLKQRGKGYALAYAAEHLRSDPPSVLIVMDADCRTDAASLAELVDSASRSGRPSQAINLLRPDRKASALLQLSTFGFMLKNLVRQRGLQRLANRAHLTGTGMAIPYEIFRASDRVHASIVEDLALGLELAEAGRAPMLVTAANVWSDPSTEAGTLTQRRRWEGGFLATALRQGPREIRRGILGGHLGSIMSGLDLMIPPLALFAIVNFAALAISAGFTFALGLEWWPVLSLLGVLAIAFLAILLAWFREGREFISLGVLVRLPLYVIWKIPMYLGLARRGAPSEWLRTGR